MANSLCTQFHTGRMMKTESMAKEILQPPRSSRFGVKYLSAPGGSGKTSSILPAFLRSTKMVNGYTHYIYLAFRNNSKRYFRLLGAENIMFNLALAQGAAFMHQCMRVLFSEPNKNGSYGIPLKNYPADPVQEMEEMTTMSLSLTIGYWCTSMNIMACAHGKLTRTVM